MRTISIALPLAVTLALLLPACVATHELNPERDGGAGDGGAGARTDPPRHATGEPVVSCGSIECALGRECCRVTMQCHDPADPASCPDPGTEEEPAACGSNAHCAPDEYCGGGCGGDLECLPRPTRDECIARSWEGDREVCGCDGVTYVNECWAAHHGAGFVHTPPSPGAVGSTAYGACGGAYEDGIAIVCSPGDGRCGERNPSAACLPHPEPTVVAPYTCEWLDPIVLCAHDEQCAGGRTCCESLGFCLDPELDAYCGEVQGWPCTVDDDCVQLEHSLRTPRLLSTRDPDSYAFYCDGAAGCGTPGTCRRVLHAPCTDEVAPVCGCDGVTYPNACEADKAYAPVAHEGPCP